MSKDAAPTGGAQETFKLQFLQCPPEAASCEDLKTTLIRWDTVLLELEQVKRHGTIMTQETKACPLLYGAPRAPARADEEAPD